MSITLNKLTGGSPGSYTYDKAGSSTNPIGGSGTISTFSQLPTQAVPTGNVTATGQPIYGAASSPSSLVGSAQSLLGSMSANASIGGTTSAPGGSSSSTTTTIVPVQRPISADLATSYDASTGQITTGPSDSSSPGAIGLLLLAVLAAGVLR